MGVLTALPIISAGNLCCCLWVIGGGLVAAYMLQQGQPAPITQADGALVGLAAGVVGAFVYLLLSIPITFLVAPMERMMMQRFIDRMANMPPEFREFATSYTAGVLGIALGFVFWLFVGAVFSTIGGLLGSAIFRRPLPPPATDIPPAA